MKLLITGAFKYSAKQLAELRELGFDIVFVKDERVPLQIDVSQIEAVVCNGLFIYNDIRKFKNLKFIQLTSSGLDRVPLDYIRKKGITLRNAKGVYSIPMAEWVVLKILEIYKKSRKFYEAQCERKWEKQRDLLELSGKTAAIIGFGDVGSEIAKRLKAFNVNIIGVGRREIENELVEKYYIIDEIDKALKESDIVILTLPLTKDTRHLIDSKRIENMRDNSVLINVSRGSLINETSLIEAVEAGKFLGIALDVFEEEPLDQESQLWNLKTAIITPHNSFVSDNINERMFKLVKANLQSVIK